MRVPVILPELGVPAAAVSVWFAAAGDPVYEGERLVEVVTEGATFDVSAPSTGVLAELRALAGDAVRAGQVLGFVDEGAE